MAAEAFHAKCVQAATSGPTTMSKVGDVNGPSSGTMRGNTQTAVKISAVEVLVERHGTHPRRGQRIGPPVRNHVLMLALPRVTEVGGRTREKHHDFEKHNLGRQLR